MSLLSKAATVITTAALLAACGGAGSDPSPSPSPSLPVAVSPSPTPVAAPSPSPDPVFDPHPPLEDLEVTTDGVLPLQIGAPLATNTGAEMVFLEEDSCYSEEMGVTEGNLDRWIADYSTGTHEDGFEMRPFGIDGTLSDPVWRIDISSQHLTTPEGIGIGSTNVELQAAYPDLIEGTSSGISEVWWIEGANGYVVFELQDDKDDLQPPGTPLTVILMRVIAADADPDFPAANSGNVAGACF